MDSLDDAEVESLVLVDVQAVGVDEVERATQVVLAGERNAEQFDEVLQGT